MIRRLAECLPFAVGAFLGAQQTWKVHCAGAYGAQFSDLPAAVVAASPGDTILVYGGVGPCAEVYTGPLINKPLRIVGFMVGFPPGTNDPTKVRVDGPIYINGILAGQQVIVCNIHTRHSVYPWGGTASPIVVTDCAGSVLLEDIYFVNSGTPGQDIRIERSSHVVLRGCFLRLGGAPMRIIDSNVLLTSFFVQHSPPDVFNPYTTTTEAIFIQRSNVITAGSIVEGVGPMGVQPPRQAALLDNGTLRVGATSVLRGGQFAGTTGQYPWEYTPAYHFVGTALSTVEKDPRAPEFSYWASEAPVITAVDETFHDWVVANEDFNVRVSGPPGGFAVLGLGEMIAPTPMFWGTLGLDPNTVFVAGFAALPATNGIYTWTFHCPSSAPNGYAFALQSLTVSPAGAFGLTIPSPLTVAWDKTRLP